MNSFATDEATQGALRGARPASASTKDSDHEHFNAVRLGADGPKKGEHLRDRDGRGVALRPRPRRLRAGVPRERLPRSVHRQERRQVPARAQRRQPRRAHRPHRCSATTSSRGRPTTSVELRAEVARKTSAARRYLVRRQRSSSSSSCATPRASTPTSSTCSTPTPFHFSAAKRTRPRLRPRLVLRREAGGGAARRVQVERLIGELSRPSDDELRAASAAVAPRRAFCRSRRRMTWTSARDEIAEMYDSTSGVERRVAAAGGSSNRQNPQVRGSDPADSTGSCLLGTVLTRYQGGIGERPARGSMKAQYERLALSPASPCSRASLEQGIQLWQLQRRTGSWDRCGQRSRAAANRGSGSPAAARSNRTCLPVANPARGDRSQRRPLRARAWPGRPSAAVGWHGIRKNVAVPAPLDLDRPESTWPRRRRSIVIECYGVLMNLAEAGGRPAARPAPSASSRTRHPAHRWSIRTGQQRNGCSRLQRDGAPDGAHRRATPAIPSSLRKV